MRPLPSSLPVALLLALAGCTAQPPAAAPAAPPPASATTANPVACIAPGDAPDPFVIDWPSDRRGDLEVALKRGIVVLSVSCTGARVLPDCSADGAYSFIGTTEREQLISLQSLDEVNANLPLLTPAVTGPSGVDFAHGASVDLGIASIGQRASSRSVVARADLKGECRDATHFVRVATLGAFAMGPGVRGQTKAAGDVFARGASGGAQMARDGSLEACRSAAADATSAPAQCGAPVRLQLKAIREESVVDPRAVVKPLQASACPPGMMRGEAGACETPSPDRSHVCAPADIADCAQQCDHGSPTSCSILGRSYQLGRGVPRDPARASDLLTKACTAGATVACGRLGEMALDAHDEPKGLRLLAEACSGGWVDGCRIGGEYAVKHAAPGTDMVANYKRACLGGEPEACWSLGAAYSDGAGGNLKNAVEAARWLALACEGDARLGCSSYAEALDAGRGVAADPARALKLLSTACDHGHAHACATLGGDYLDAHSVPRDITRGLGLLERGCKLGDAMTCWTAVSRRRGLAAAGVPADPALEKAMLTTSCGGGIALACTELRKL